MDRIDGGAEASIYECDIFGVKALAKVRQPKRYRVKILDDELRKTRTRREAKVLALLMLKNVPVPAVLAVGEYVIFMEKLEGVLLRDADKGKEFYEKVGNVVRDMHNAGVAHGDMTTANIIAVGNTPYVIDLGLAEITVSVEEKALDILLMKRSLGESLYAKFLSGYSDRNINYKTVMNRLFDIEKRGRYQVRTLQ